MEQKPRSKVEEVKAASRGLRGSIAEQLPGAAGRFEPADVQILKFHGIYQQDDRDQRQELKRQGLDKKYIFMIRTKNPGGGELTAEQWMAMDEVATACGNGSLRITTRAGIQFHGVGKGALKRAIRLLNSRLVTTYGACGDGNRNTTACPVANVKRGFACDGQYYAQLISRHLGFHSNAYYEIWLNGQKLQSSDDTEPLYGSTYLPRKFKIGIADHEENCIDVLTNDIGLVPICERGQLRGFTLLVGGGMGSTHKKQETFPRLADPLGFVVPQRLLEVVTRIVELQRDEGNRSDRTQARFKYLVESWGVERVREEINQRLGWTLPAPAPFSFTRSDLHLGWHEQRQPGLWFLGIPIENGRVADSADCKLKTGLGEVIRRFQPAVRFTTSQDIVLSGIPESLMESVSRCLADFGIRAAREVSRLRRSAMACPALPTCGLAVAEAERFLPNVMEELERAGYGIEGPTIRMSGCPNSCSRPPTAEIGIIGRSRETYNLYLGGTARGTRLGRLYAENVKAAELAAQLAHLLDIYRNHRKSGETFGDFANRLGPEGVRRLMGQRMQSSPQAQVAAS